MASSWVPAWVSAVSGSATRRRPEPAELTNVQTSFRPPGNDPGAGGRRNRARRPAAG
jgi:hypothetical protein